MAEYRKNVITSIFPLTLSQPSDVICDFVPTFSEHQLFGLKKPDAVQSAVAEINNFLNSSGKRLQGLLLLEQVLGQCSSDVFSNNCLTWMDLLLQALKSHGSAEQYQSTLHVLKIVLRKITVFPELSRDISFNKMKLLLPALISLKSEETREAVVSCIITCILCFPGSTRPFKGQIESLLVQELDSPSPSQVAIRCFAILTRCSTGPGKGDKLGESWTQQYNKLMSTLNCLLTQLYSGLETGEKTQEDRIFSRPVPNTQPDQTLCLVRRFHTLCACLSSLLSEPFPTMVSLPVEEIMQFLCRTFAVQIDMLMKKVSTDQLLLLTFLPMLHTAAYRVFSSLIVCAKRLLIPFVDTIVGLFVQSLTSTHLHKAQPTAEKPFSKLRQAVYRSLELWVEVTGASSYIMDVPTGKSNVDTDSVLCDLLTEIFYDIEQQKAEVMQLEKSNKGPSLEPPAKKRKKKGKGSHHQELPSDTQQAVEVHSDNDTVNSALKALKRLISSLGVLMPEKILNGVKKTVCKLVREMQMMTVAPYTSHQCRQFLYEALLATVLVPRPDVSTLKTALAVFERGCQDTQSVVGSTCRDALSVCQHLIHPVLPTIPAPVVSSAEWCPKGADDDQNGIDFIRTKKPTAPNKDDKDVSVSSTSLTNNAMSVSSTSLMNNAFSVSTFPESSLSSSSSSKSSTVLHKNLSSSPVSKSPDRSTVPLNGTPSHSVSSSVSSTLPETTVSSPHRPTILKRKRSSGESDEGSDNDSDEEVAVQERKETTEDIEPSQDDEEKDEDERVTQPDVCDSTASSSAIPLETDNTQQTEIPPQSADVAAMMNAFVATPNDSDDDDISDSD